MPTLIATLTEEAKALDDRIKAADAAINDAEGNFDADLLAGYKELNGDDANAKLDHYNQLVAEWKEKEAARDKAVKAEKERRARDKAQKVTDETGIKVGPRNAEPTEPKNFREAVRTAFDGKDFGKDLVRASFGLGDEGIKAILQVAGGQPLDNRYAIHSTRVGRISQLLMMFNTVTIADGDSVLRGIDFAEGGSPADILPRDTAADADRIALGDAAATANASSYPVQEIRAWQDIPRVTANDHTGLVDGLGMTLENLAIRKLWAQVIAGTGAGSQLFGANSQITNSKAVQAGTTILKYLEEEIEALRVAGCDPSMVLLNASNWATLRDDFRQLHYRWPDGPDNMVNDVPVYSTPSLPANIAFIGDFDYAFIGTRKELMWESNPYTSAKAGSVYVEACVEAACAYWQAKTGGASPQFLKLTATDNFKAAAPPSSLEAPAPARSRSRSKPESVSGEAADAS